MRQRRQMLVPRRRRGVRSVSPTAILWLAGVFTMMVWLFVSVNPFQPTNPFLREITIGQSVLGDWRYGGTTASGALRFYEAYYNIELPANSTTFAADGMFVRIDGHTPTTLTFEPAVESQTIGPIIVLGLVLFAIAPLWALRHTLRGRRLGRTKPRWRSGRSQGR